MNIFNLSQLTTSERTRILLRGKKTLDESIMPKVKEIVNNVKINGINIKNQEIIDNPLLHNKFKK